MATYGPQAVDSHGLVPTYNAAGGSGDRVPVGVLLHIVNSSGSSITLTIDAVSLVDTDLATPDRTVTVPTGGQGKFVRLLPASVYQSPSDGLVGLSWSATASVTFAVLS